MITVTEMVYQILKYYTTRMLKIKAGNSGEGTVADHLIYAS
jgi:hypothetical protein